MNNLRSTRSPLNKFRFNFSIRWVFLFTAVVAIGIGALQNATEFIVSVCPYFLLALAIAACLVAVRGTPSQRVFSFGALVGGIASFGVSMGMPLPQQMYLCGSPFLRNEFGMMLYSSETFFGNIVAYELIILQAFVCGITSLMIRSRSTRTSSRLSPLIWQFIGLISLAAVCVVLGKFLVDQRSNIVALVCHEVLNTLFFIALVGAALRRKKKPKRHTNNFATPSMISRLFARRISSSRVFWSVVAVTIWLYLVFTFLPPDPFLGMPGVQQYLSTHHPSVDSAWVSAICVFIFVFSLFCGLVAKTIVELTGKIRNKYFAIAK